MNVRLVEKIEENFDLVQKLELQRIKMQPVPLKAVTTSKYIRETLEERKFGKVDEVEAGICRDNELIAVVMRWRDRSKDDVIRDYNSFVDACAVMFPLREFASVMTMGSEDAPVNIWLWRADNKVYDVISRGLGTTRRRDAKMSGLRAFGEYSDGTWTVVFVRPLKSTNREEFVDLSPKKRTGIAFAVWEGSNRERGPLKAYSGEFMSLEVL
ncbi:MAG: ethylbenzene dehydrogenase-related protein [Archaeoglobaceae archaeon]